MAGITIKRTLKYIVAGLLVVVTAISIFVYNNFNQLLSEALMKSFDSNIMSDVYELKFEKLRVNLVGGDIQVFNVSLMPRDTHSQQYPYINSYVKFKTHKLALKNVQLKTLLQTNMLKLDSIEIDKPDVTLQLAGDNNIFLPFVDTTMVAQAETEDKKRSILSFILKKIDLVGADFHIQNIGKQRGLEIQNFNIGVSELNLEQRAGVNHMFYKHIELFVGSCKANMSKGPFLLMQFKDFAITIDSLAFRNTIDTTTFDFNEFTAGLNELDILTKDSTYSIRLDSFLLSYKDKSINIGNASLSQNISKAALQSKFRYQHPQISGSVGSLNLINVDFDSLIYNNIVRVDEILVDEVSLNIYKDKTRPFDFSRFPKYLGQKITSLDLPIDVKLLKATNVNIFNTEKMPDGKLAKVTVNRINATVENITNRSQAKDLIIRGQAYLANKIHFNVTMAFNYAREQVAYDARFGEFDFKELDPIISLYTPARIMGGKVDQIHLTGTAFRTRSTGTMEFRFHDLEIDLKLKEQAEWKNDIVSFAANTVLSKDNPFSPNIPPRIVKYDVPRDMNKGFINLLIKSALTGLKETIIMSKENKKAYKAEKRKAKRERKKNN